MMQCPNCGKGLKADLAAIGKKVNCPGCKRPFVHPDATELTVRQQSGDRRQLTRALEAKQAAAESHDRLDRGFHPIVPAVVLVVLVGGGAGLYRALNPPAAPSPTEIVAAAPQASPTPAPAQALLDRDGDSSSPTRSIGTTAPAATLPVELERALAADAPWKICLTPQLERGMQVDAPRKQATAQWDLYRETRSETTAAALKNLVGRSIRGGTVPATFTTWQGGRTYVYVTPLAIDDAGAGEALLNELRRRGAVPPYVVTLCLDGQQRLFVDVATAAGGTVGAPPEAAKRASPEAASERRDE